MDPASQRPWKPILTGTELERARHILDQLAVTLAPARNDRRSDLDASAGRALFFAYRVEAQHADEDARESRALVDRHLDQAIDALAANDAHPALWSGFVGVAWTAQHLRGRFAAPDEDDDNETIDLLLCELLARSPWTGSYDLIGGLVGLGVYGLERLNRAVGQELVALAIDRLGELAESRDGGLTWLTPARELPPWQRVDSPNGHYNCGAAHGVPGVVTLLAGACAAGIRVERARPLLDGAVAWLLAQRNVGAPAGLAFPSWIADGKPAPARLAWCYGDPGVAAALLAAGSAVAEPRWQAAALDLGRHAARLGRDPAAALALSVHDAGLCHGAAGLALIFHRLWQEAPEPLFAEAARWWYGRVLDGHRPGSGVGGYQAWSPAFGGRAEGWVDDDSFLVGAVGVGLALMAASGDVEPAWDRLLATSLAPV
jgi:lantibiotic biosynthesis protein